MDPILPYWYLIPITKLYNCILNSITEYGYLNKCKFILTYKKLKYLKIV